MFCNLQEVISHFSIGHISWVLCIYRYGLVSGQEEKISLGTKGLNQG